MARLCSTKPPTLFEKDTDTIGLHLRNIFVEGELTESATTEECSVVQREGTREVRRTVRFFNLDAIISVGYRVNSKRGTQFRIWATRILRDHVFQGYSVNLNRLRDLNQTARLVAGVIDRQDLSGDEAKALLRRLPQAGELVLPLQHPSAGPSHIALPVAYDEPDQAERGDHAAQKLGNAMLRRRKAAAIVRLGIVRRDKGAPNVRGARERAHKPTLIVRRGRLRRHQGALDVRGVLLRGHKGARNVRHGMLRPHGGAPDLRGGL